MIIQQTDVEQLRSLRSLVLRPGQPIEKTNYERDNEKSTLHYAAKIDGAVLSIATIYPEEFSEVKSGLSYRLRGMATHPEYRRQGLARGIMCKVKRDLKYINVDLIWCRARIVAVEFYQSLGFVKIGPIYEIEEIGPHYTMYKNI